MKIKTLKDGSIEIDASGDIYFLKENVTLIGSANGKSINYSNGTFVYYCDKLTDEEIENRVEILRRFLKTGSSIKQKI